MGKKSRQNNPRPLGQNSLDQILNVVMLRYERSLADPYDTVVCENSISDVPRLVKALRRAIDGFYDQQGSSVMGRYPKIGQKALDDISSILTGEQDKEG